jgi:hypothetical protein
LGLFSMGCNEGGVGDPCTPEDEYQTEFSGFSVTEVNVESRSFQCETRVCLVNNFQGRVSCPYGQTQADIDACLMGGTSSCTKPGGAADRICTVPGTSGARAEDIIEVSVEPQLFERQADQAVYCSCRCDGPDPNARYCECPSGFVCEELVDDLGLGSGQLAGSYCVRDGTLFDQSQRVGGTCSVTEGNCGNEGANP